jgi:predicted membrane protein
MWMIKCLKKERTEVKWSDFVEWVYLLFTDMYKCFCIACGSIDDIFVLKLFVLCHLSFVTLQSIEDIIKLFILYFIILYVCFHFVLLLFLLMYITVLASCVPCKGHCHPVEKQLQ